MFVPGVAASSIVSATHTAQIQPAPTHEENVQGSAFTDEDEAKKKKNHRGIGEASTDFSERDWKLRKGALRKVSFSGDSMKK